MSLEEENAALLAANRDLKLHWDVLKADYDKAIAKLELQAALASRRDADPGIDQRVNELREWLGGAKA